MQISVIALFAHPACAWLPISRSLLLLVHNIPK